MHYGALVLGAEQFFDVAAAHCCCRVGIVFSSFYSETRILTHCYYYYRRTGRRKNAMQAQSAHKADSAQMKMTKTREEKIYIISDSPRVLEQRQRYAPPSTTATIGKK